MAMMKRFTDSKPRRTGQRHHWCIRSSVWRYMLLGVPIRR